MIIPFFISHAGCPHQCIFCNQKNITGHSASVAPSNIAETISRYLAQDTGEQPTQVAFYGGTFTALSIDLQQEYLHAVRDHPLSARIKGIRISTRPDCIDPVRISLLKQYNVTIVELGAQSMDDQVLELSGRGHTSLDTVRSVHLLREQGLMIGLQLMAGLPGDSSAGFLRSIRSAISLDPDFVRIYPLTVIRDTPLADLYGKGLYQPLSLDEAVSQCSDALELLDDAKIPVIRVGLQSSQELTRPGMIVAGPYHPAFRQLVESSRYLTKMRTLLQNRAVHGGGALFLVDRGEESTVVGQHRSNILDLKKEFGLHSIDVAGTDGLVRKGMIVLGTRDDTNNAACLERNVRC